MTTTHTEPKSMKSRTWIEYLEEEDKEPTLADIHNAIIELWSALTFRIKNVTPDMIEYLINEFRCHLVFEMTQEEKMELFNQLTAM